MSGRRLSNPARHRSAKVVGANSHLDGVNAPLPQRQGQRRAASASPASASASPRCASSTSTVQECHHSCIEVDGAVPRTLDTSDATPLRSITGWGRVRHRDDRRPPDERGVACAHPLPGLLLAGRNVTSPGVPGVFMGTSWLRRQSNPRFGVGCPGEAADGGPRRSDAGPQRAWLDEDPAHQRHQANEPAVVGFQ
jgi:hypothetical protein